MTTVPTVDVVIVAWKHDATIQACLTALEATAREGFTLQRVVLVDNAPGQSTRPSIPSSLPLMTVDNDTNVGFAPACNQGARGSTADFLLFLNPDACLGPASLTQALAWTQHPSADDVGVVGLPLVDADGTRQSTCGRFPNARTTCTQMLGLSRLGQPWLQGFRMTEWHHAGHRAVDYVSGACLLVRRGAFEQVGGFDPRFAVYLEDVDLCLRLEGRGWRTVFLDADAVTHVSGWDRGDARAWRLAHSWRSVLRYAWKHLPLTAAVLVTLCLVTLAVPARVGAALAERSWRDVGAAGQAGLWLVTLLCRDTPLVRGVTRPRRPAPSTARPTVSHTRTVTPTDAGATSRRWS